MCKNVYMYMYNTEKLIYMCRRTEYGVRQFKYE